MGWIDFFLWELVEREPFSNCLKRPDDNEKCKSFARGGDRLVTQFLRILLYINTFFFQIKFIVMIVILNSNRCIVYAIAISSIQIFVGFGLVTLT